MLFWTIFKLTYTSSVLSLFSFIMQLGCVLASIVGYVVSSHSDFKLLWLVAGALLVVCVGCLRLYLRKGNSKQSV